VLLVDDRDTIDHIEVGRLQVGYLVGRGVGGVAYAGTTESWFEFYSKRNLEGVTQGCAAHGLPAPLVQDVGYDAASLDSVIDAWPLDQPAQFGVCAHNDEVALRLVARMRMRGIVPGKDVLIIGADGIAASELELTTIRMDWRKLSRDVVGSVLAGVQGESRRTPSQTGYYQLIKRTSA
jgi:DNA-binding LacI/PurR family transcriptional regulator